MHGEYPHLYYFLESVLQYFAWPGVLVICLQVKIKHLSLTCQDKELNFKMDLTVITP